jgi:Na+-driven multidrug efflux pump
VAQVLCFALRGAGATRIGAGVPFVSQTLIQLPLSWWAAVTLGHGLVGLCAVQLVVAMAEAAAAGAFWAGPRWSGRKQLSRLA